MNIIFEYIDDKHIKINLKNFLEGQISINDKFPNPNRDSKFINVYDNMSGQIEEEIFECKEEIYKNNKFKKSYQTNESIEEFVDIFMYIGSLIVETANYFDIDIFEFLKENNFEKIDIIDTYVINSLFDRNLPHDDFIAYIRRYIYDRKYHKDSNEKPDNYENNLLKLIIVSAFLPRKNENTITIYDPNKNSKIPEFIDNMNPYLQDLLFAYDNRTVTDSSRNVKERIALLNSIINKKQNYINNL